MKIAVVTQARISSTRLPEKVLRPVGGTSLLGLHLTRAGKAKRPTHFVVAVADEPGWEKIAAVATSCNWQYSKGDVNNVLSRFYFAVENIQPDYIVRITSDCPLIDPDLMDSVISFCIDGNLDYAANGLVETFPDGEDIEVFKFSALREAYEKAKLLSELEHVTPYIKKHSSFLNGVPFRSDNYYSGGDYKAVRITVDTPQDLQVVENLVKKLGSKAGWKEYTDLYLADSAIHGLNNKIIRNEGYLKSLLKDQKNE